MILGGILLSKSNSIVENVTQYDVKCDSLLWSKDKKCRLDIQIAEDIAEPVYV